MSPRSLLFSSDQETSRRLCQALNELELNAESCPEIFAALKTLTSRSFAIIIVDWDEGLEASFLLKTARELKTNREAFVIVIGKTEASAALRQAGADLVLSKPIVPERVRHALLSNDDFLARMKAWLGQQVRPTLPRSAHKEPWPTSGAEQHPAPAPAAGSSKPAANDLLANLSFASLESGSVRKNILETLVRSTLFSGPSSPPRGRSRRNAFLRRTTIGVIFFAVGYVFSQPLSKAGISVVEAYHGTLQTTRHWLARSPNDPTAAELAQSDSSRAQRRDASSRIRVIPVRHEGWRGEAAAPPAVQTKEAAKTAEQDIQPASQKDQDPAPAVARRVRIPESLDSPFPGVASARDVATNASPGFLDAVEPVSIPEYLSDKLLLDKVQPSYPEQALRSGLQGPVVLEAWIGRDGKIRNLKLIRGSLLLGQAAFEAVKQWRYKPYVLNGQTVEAQTLVTVDFKLP
jgi:TonB family protein